jgi:hypothetical protein
MAHWGISNTQVNQLDGSVAGKRPSASASVSMRHKFLTVFHVALFSAAFIFVAALVCGVLV